MRLWKPSDPPGEGKTIGLYRAEDGAELERLFRALPIYEWMRVTVTPLGQHPNDPATARTTADQVTARAGALTTSPQQKPIMNSRLPDPRLTKIYRLEATLGSALDVGEIRQGGGVSCR